MIEELRRFLMVAKEGNLTRTAEKIFLTQSALSQSIARLEKHIGTKLFVQHGKQLQLTPNGVAVVTIGNKILELWEKAKDPKILSSTMPAYTIGMFDNAALRLGPYFKSSMTDGSPHLEFIIDTSAKLFTQLKLGTIDIAVCVIDKKNQLPNGIDLIKTFSEKLIPVSSKKYSKEINKIPFILYNKGSLTRVQLDSVFIEKGIAPNIVAESTSVTFMKELASLGTGVALLPKNFINAELEQGILIEQKLSVHWKREFGIFINKEGLIKKDNTSINEIIKWLNKK